MQEGVLMEKHFITIENLACLGVLDDFYDLYYTAVGMYESEWENYEDSKVDPFLIEQQINARLKSQTQKLLDSFFCKYTYLFTGDYPRLHPNATMIKQFYVIYLKHVAPLTFNKVTVSFSTFLKDVLEPMLITRVWSRIVNDRPKTPYEIVESQVQTHFCNLVESARNHICVHSGGCDNIPQDLIVFKSLSAISCNLKGHCVKNSTMEVARLDSDDTIILPTHHCKDCGRLFIGNETLKQYEKVWGKLCINTRNDCYAANESDFYTKESPLHKLGYNVIAGKLSEKERQALLIKIYEKKWLTLFEIQRDIEKAIRIFEYRNHYQKAVKKWKDDLYFITEYVKNR